MVFDTWIVFVGTVLTMMLTPGPSQFLMLSNSADHGFYRSLATAAGDLSANALQMLAAGLGIATLIAASQDIFVIIQWGGVIYLIWLGVQKIKTAQDFQNNIKAGGLSKKSLKNLWLQGFVTSAANPKAIVFFAVLFPQFIKVDSAFGEQFFIFSLTYLVIDGLFLSLYGVTAGYLMANLTCKARVWSHRFGGFFLILAAVVLGVK